MATGSDVSVPDSDPSCGRESELARIAQWRDGGVPVLTITGPIGIGKSHLARAYYTRSAARQGSHAWVDLFGCGGSEQVGRAIGHALRHDGPLHELPSMLVVLDAADDAIEALRPLLAECRGPARFLLTSRESLNLPLESRLLLTGLPGAVAARLFAARCESACGAAPADLQMSCRIVEAFDRNPLAIELAASQTVAMTLSEILEGAEGLLAAPDDELVEWLEAKLLVEFERSWSRLPTSLQSALCRVALLRGPFPREAAEALAVDARALRELVRRCLLRTLEVGGELLFAVEPPIRGLAERRLSELGDAELLRQTWCEWSNARAEAEHADWTLHPHVSQLANLTAVATDRMRADDRRGTLRALRALGRVASSAGVTPGALKLCDRIAAWLGEQSEDRFELHHARGRLRHLAGFEAAAEQDLTAALHTPDESMRAEVHYGIANLYRHRQEFDRATSHYQAAKQSPRLRPSVLTAEASMAHERGQLEAARELFEQSLLALRQAEHVGGEGLALQNFGIMLQEAGELAQAEQTLRRALEIHRAQGNRRFEGIGCFDLGGVALERDELDRARGFYQQARAIAIEVGERRENGLSTCMLAVTAALAGELHEAGALFAAARQLLLPLDQPALHAALGIHEQHAELARIWARAALGQAYELPASLPVGAAGDEVRFATRLVERVRARIEELGRHLVVARDGSWFRAPEQARVSLDRHAVLQALLRELASAEHVGVEELVGAGWPEVRSLTTAVKNRLNVALSKLRKLGLERYLRREGTRYRLEDSILV